MKVERISIQNFKQFECFDISFKNKTLNEVSDRFAILGDNGSGKTTLLQAIALPLAFATGRIQSISDFDWISFLPGRYWQSQFPRIELEVSFEEEELEATRQISRTWYEAQPPEFRTRKKYVEPSAYRRINVILNGDYWLVGNDTAAERAQFRGRYYVQWLLNRGDPSVRSFFVKLPGIFWFDQFRNLTSKSSYESLEDISDEKNTRTFSELGIGHYRKYLVDWKRKQETGIKYSVDFLQELEKLYQRVFPNRSFWGLEDGFSSDSASERVEYFLLNDGQRKYDLMEMSGGEQSVFPILYEIVRQQITYSIVLIDEIDLNLHPNAAQFLVSQLPKIAPTCQFIFTTHSRSVIDVISESNIYRLTGGALCL